MDRLGRILFVALDGEPPSEEDLDVLPDWTAVAELVRSTFAPFLSNSGDAAVLTSGKEAVAPAEGLLLVYAFGHAWLGAEGPETATKAGVGSTRENARELLRRLIPASAADRTIVVLDCCHAAAFDAFLPESRLPRLIVYACGSDEKAISLRGERASRLSLTIANRLVTRAETVDLVQTIGEVAKLLDSDGVLRGQTVDYRMNGRAIVLASSQEAGQSKREGTVARIRNMLIAGGGIAATVLVALGWFYWSHVLIDIDLAGLPNVARDIRMIATEEDPATNGSRIIEERTISGNRTRLWMPASNVLLRVEAAYGDNAERALAFHLTLQRSFDPRTKTVSLVLPAAEAVLAHPDMAFVPVTPWFHGLDREPQTNANSFWIDIRPPTVAAYLNTARQFVQSGELTQDESFIFTARQRSAAVDAVGLDQLNTLSEDLGAIFGQIEAGDSSNVAGPGEIVVGLGELPCDSCPAPMTRKEAELFCSSRTMRLPTDFEWELAVRGVDGRGYPWGNQLDKTRANIPGLPEKDAPSPSLKPVDAYPNERSPFGLIDTVGNAGDWVVAPYERSYMGATYQYNPEDATSFRLLPITDEDLLVREITARCVADAQSAGPP